MNNNDWFFVSKERFAVPLDVQKITYDEKDSDEIHAALTISSESFLRIEDLFFQVDPKTGSLSDYISEGVVNHNYFKWDYDSDSPVMRLTQWSLAPSDSDSRYYEAVDKGDWKPVSSFILFLHRPNNKNK